MIKKNDSRLFSGLEAIKQAYSGSSEYKQRMETVKYLDSLAFSLDKIYDNIVQYRMYVNDPQFAIKQIAKLNQMVDILDNVAEKIEKNRKKPLKLRKPYIEYFKQAETLVNNYLSFK